MALDIEVKGWESFGASQCGVHGRRIRERTARDVWIQGLERGDLPGDGWFESARAHQSHYPMVYL